jgi:transmembrane sensor
MSLRDPVLRDVREPFDDVAVERMWRGVASRRAAKGSPPARTWVLATAVLVLCVGVLGLPRLLDLARDAGPLQLAGGGAVVALTAPQGERSYALTDGSRIDVGPGAVFTARQNSGRLVDGSLHSGAATFDIRPGGPRKWTIDCGLATVEVVGTRFVIDARPERVSVHVERGRVRVTSAAGVKELGAGEDVEVEAPPTSAPVAVPLAPTPPESPAPPASSPALRDVVAPKPIPAASWRSLAREGDYSGAYATLGATGIAHATPRADVDELLALADVARLSGHPGDAVAPLSRVVSESPGDGRASLAAFTLGRIELDTLGHPAPAADAFARAIALGLPSGLAEDGYTRLVEARVKAGDRAGAESACAAYLRSFPAGARSTSMRRWLDDGSDAGRSSPSLSP